MATVPPNSTDTPAREEEDGLSGYSPVPLQSSKELDAGALFVLKSRGSWLHCGYHLTTSIVAPALLSLPFAFALLGWVGGVFCLTMGALVTFYSYNLLSLVLEHHEQLGHRQLRFRDMATDILGPGWSRYYVGPLQFSICYGAVVACTLLGGQSLKFIYLLSNPDGTMKLYQFIVICGVLMLVLAQIPSFHSLRHINLVSLILCLAYSACTTVGSIYIAKTQNPTKDYSVNGDGKNRMFGAFNAISIIATTYGNGIIPEIQATIAPPVKGKMFKGLCVCYAVTLATFFCVAISGYWAFGNQAQGTVLANFMVDGKPLVPMWFLLMTNVFTLLQVSATSVVYMQPTNEVLERKFADPKRDQFSVRNVVPRFIFRSLSVIIATILAAMLPFFGDIFAVFGAFGFIPLDFVLPMVFYNVTFRPSKGSLIFWGNTFIAVVFSFLGALGAISSVRQIILDAKTYSLFSPSRAMATVPPNSTDTPAREEEDGLSGYSPVPLQSSKELDAGALFVLKSRGSWLHCGYHLTTSIVAPALLSLPFAFALLGWVGGVFCLTMGALVTFYSYNLLSLVLEHHEQLGHRQLRFRDMATDILGPGWSRYYVGPLQFSICYGAVVACTLLGGQSLKFIYLLSNPDGTMKLYQFIVICGVLMLVLAQIPSFHSLRHINLVSLILCLAYSACTTVGSIYIAKTQNPAKDYSVNGDGKNRMFGAFNAISIIATTYGNGIIPEIQATIAPPVKGKMFKGLCICYAIILATFFSVSISGYWAFGNQAKGTVLANFMVEYGKPLVPMWFLLMTNVFTLLQVSATSVVYMQLTNEMLERKFADPKRDQFSVRNVVPRLVFRSLSVIIATTLAAMLPFFGDIFAVLGAFGCIPLDFVLPMVFYNVTFRPSKGSLIFWGNTFIAVVFSFLGALGAISSIRQIIIDAKIYSLFANM
ncbi:hypothetical protein HHK36_011310 [Tetracentron sinense]|uniref:Amino acid transporter transmembrane domain-containing protein n=1 Tax=Tetracentron sinense TaxID=13715 RepID=A0A834ZBN3_TETSI|nr:hypothetical protein HHK36_011310 [Tetracentron sinense]